MPARGATKDKGKRLEFDGKDIQLQNGAIHFSRTPFLDDHFLDALVSGRWTATETGAGSGKAIFAVSATLSGGQAVGTAGATATNAEELGGTFIGWKPSEALQKPLAFEARIKTGVITTADIAVGLADNKTYGASGINVMSATSTFSQSAASDAAVLQFSTTPTSGAAFTSGGNHWFAATSKATVDTATRLSTAMGAVAANTFYTVRVEIDSVGNVSFFGVKSTTAGAAQPVFLGRVAVAVTPGTALTPYFSVSNNNNTSPSIAVDYCVVGAGF